MDRQHTSFDFSTSAHQELQRIAGHTGLSSTGVLLVAIHLLSRMPPKEIADLAPMVAKLFSQRIEHTDEDGQVSRFHVGGYGSKG